MAIVAEGVRQRIYVEPNKLHSEITAQVDHDWVPELTLSTHPQYMGPPRFGLGTVKDLFTDRQLVALGTFIELLAEVKLEVSEHYQGHWNQTSDVGSDEYANAVITYLSFALGKAANYWSTCCSWHTSAEKLVSTFGLPVLRMVWDFTETNPFSDSSGNWSLGVVQAAKVLDNLVPVAPGFVSQRDAVSDNLTAPGFLISTDPPYYDNVPYADLSDFFYAWLRKALGEAYPEVFRTLAVPKATELVADQVRHGGRKNAQSFFEAGLQRVFNRLQQDTDRRFPMSVYYAFRQHETEKTVLGKDESVSSTGWETMLEGLLAAGLRVVGTWPVRTEQSGGLRQAGRNALASSIVLVCRPRSIDAPIATRNDFTRALRRELPEALKRLQYGNIAPVDLAQASIGPGMTVFSRYTKVMESSGDPMRVRTALQLINQELDAVLAAQEGELDADTRWAITWFEQYGTRDGAYGDAETLSKAKDTSISGLVEAGILEAKGGKVRLLSRDELRADWDPATERRITVWEVTQYLIRSLYQDGEAATADLVRRVGSYADLARTLAYRLYTVCERKKWAEEALAYNSLVIAWPELSATRSSRG